MAQRVVREATNKSETVLKKVDEQLALINEEIEKVKKHQKTVKEWQEEVIIIILIQDNQSVLEFCFVVKF